RSSPPFALRLRDRGAGAHAARAGVGVPRAARASPRGGADHRAGGTVRRDPGPAPCAGERSSRRKDREMDSPLRLIPTDPLDRLARTLEALLVVASVPLSVDELAEAAADDPERIEAALRLVGERFSEERSGIVLEHV